MYKGRGGTTINKLMGLTITLSDVNSANLPWLFKVWQDSGHFPPLEHTHLSELSWFPLIKLHDFFPSLPSVYTIRQCPYPSVAAGKAATPLFELQGHKFIWVLSYICSSALLKCSARCYSSANGLFPTPASVTESGLQCHTEFHWQQEIQVCLLPWHLLLQPNTRGRHFPVCPNAMIDPSFLFVCTMNYGQSVSSGNVLSMTFRRFQSPFLAFLILGLLGERALTDAFPSQSHQLLPHRIQHLRFWPTWAQVDIGQCCGSDMVQVSAKASCVEF
jgi:hypothetical protein